MAPSPRELRAALRAARRESQRQAAAGPAVPSGTESSRREAGERFREEEARRIAAAARTAVSWDTESEYRRQGGDQSSREKEARRIPALVDPAIGRGAGRGSGRGASGRRMLGERSVTTRLEARRRAEEQVARENEGDIFYTISHNMAPVVRVPASVDERAATSPVPVESEEGE